MVVVTGTGTGVGKTVVTAAVAAVALERGGRVAMLKPVQTGVEPGEPGDIAEVARLAPGVTCRELARYPDPLAPATAARRLGVLPVTPAAVAAAARELALDHDLVLVEGAGGLLVRLCDDPPGTLADVAGLFVAPQGVLRVDGRNRLPVLLDVPVLVVATAGLGTLNHTALTVEVLRARGLACSGVVIGAWPAGPDLAARCNLDDLPLVTGVPLLGAIPDGAGDLDAARFAAVARHGLAPALGGAWHTPRP
ncbi:MAG: dethiobiotin synthase [Pseudonocardia sp.]